MTFEKAENLETPEQRTEVLKKTFLIKLENIEGKEKISEALDLALTLHLDQKPRPDGPYADHILRGVDRLLDLGVTNSDILIASIFHDSVEDQSQKLSGMISTTEELSMREKALEFLKQKYGERVSAIVNSVTNPEELDNLEFEERNKEYALHIQRAIEDPDVLNVKLSDFMDNGLKFMDIPDTRRRYRLAQKYFPIYKIFIDRLKRDDIVLPEEIKDRIIRELSEAEAIAANTIKENE